jgi:nucleoside-diphosphate-sugar epimerase
MLDEMIGERLIKDGRRIVVVGASGWLGRATLHDLWQLFGSATRDRVVCVGSAQRPVQLGGGREIEQIALTDLPNFPSRPTLVLHFAFLTKDRAQEMSAAAYRTANDQIGRSLMAALEPIGAEGIFVASSGAAYHADDEAAPPAMRLYGALKLADEVRFTNWARNTRRRAVIARIFNVTGPYINKHDAYALASFILDGLAGRSIEVKAPRRVVRAYVPIGEIMSLAFAELMADNQGVSHFDTGGRPLELGEVAALVANQFDDVAVRRAPITEAQDDVYHGDVEAYAEMLTRHGLEAMPLDAQIAKTIDYLRVDQ